MKDMKWTKVDPQTEEPISRGHNQFMENDYIAYDGFGRKYKIVNNSLDTNAKKRGWYLECEGDDLGKFKTLKAAKEKAFSDAIDYEAMDAIDKNEARVM